MTDHDEGRLVDRVDRGRQLADAERCWWRCRADATRCEQNSASPAKDAGLVLTSEMEAAGIESDADDFS